MRTLISYSISIRVSSRMILDDNFRTIRSGKLIFSCPDLIAIVIKNRIFSGISHWYISVITEKSSFRIKYSVWLLIHRNTGISFRSPESFISRFELCTTSS